jgi:hypothetical protein
MITGNSWTTAGTLGVAFVGMAKVLGLSSAVAPFTQWPAVKAFVDQPDLGPVATGTHAVYAALATGFVSRSGNEKIDALFSRGGMASLLTTVWPRIARPARPTVFGHVGDRSAGRLLVRHQPEQSAGGTSEVECGDFVTGVRVDANQCPVDLVVGAELTTHPGHRHGW